MKLLSKRLVSLDIETLGQRYNAVIVSIGACKFSINTGIVDTFSVNIDPESCTELGLKTDKSTLEWWSTQPKEARMAWRSNPVSLVDGLTQFIDWWGSDKNQIVVVNGASFDCPIMNSALNVVGLTTPWHFRNEFDLRTMYTMLDTSNKEVREMLKLTDGYHTALDDAKAQANCMIHLLKSLES